MVSVLRLARGSVRRAVRSGLGADRELALHRAYHNVLRRTGRFAPPEDALTLAVLSLLAARARTILDVGANTGRYTHLFAEAASPAATFHAFEPHPGARALLEANTGRDPRVHIHDCALGEAEATLTLVVPLDERGNAVSALGRVGAAVAGEHSLAVRVRTLDGLVAAGELTLEQPVLAKIDVEGHEGAVLAGARRLLEAGASVYFESQEVHLDRAGSTSPWPALFEAGYEVVVRDSDGWRRCDGPIAGWPNYLGLPGGTLPAGALPHAALVATLAGWAVT